MDEQVPNHSVPNKWRVGSLKSVNSLKILPRYKFSKVQFGKSVSSIGATTQLSFTFSDNVVETFTLGSIAESILILPTGGILEQRRFPLGHPKHFGTGVARRGSNSTLVVSSAGSELNMAYPIMIGGALDGAQGYTLRGKLRNPIFRCLHERVCSLLIATFY